MKGTPLGEGRKARGGLEGSGRGTMITFYDANQRSDAASSAYARMSGCLLELDGAGTVRTCQAGAREVFGKSTAEVEGARLSEITLGLSDEEVTSLLEQARDQGPVEINVATPHTNHVALHLIHANDDRFYAAGRELGIINEMVGTIEEKERTALLGSTMISSAHEINNTLGNQLTLLEVLEQPAQSDRERRSHLDLLKREVRRSSDVVRRVLSMAREWEGEVQDFAVGEIVHTILEAQEGLIHGEGIRVDNRLSRQSPMTRAKRKEIEYIIMTLIRNAIHALSRRAKRAPLEGQLTIRETKADGEHVGVTIEDNAGGLPETTRRRVFEGVMTGAPESLGLVISRVYAFHNKGMLLLDSEYQEGARFHLLLPRTEALSSLTTQDAPEDAGLAPERTTDLAYEEITLIEGARILVVDDEPVLRRSLVQILELYDPEVIAEAETAAEARAILRNDARFDIILLDIRLPDGRGTDLFAEMIEQDPEAADRVHFMVGERVEGWLERFLHESRAPYITKPFAPEALIRRISRIRAAQDSGEAWPSSAARGYIAR